MKKFLVLALFVIGCATAPIDTKSPDDLLLECSGHVACELALEATDLPTLYGWLACEKKQNHPRKEVVKSLEESIREAGQ